MISTVDVEGSTVWIDPSADRPADMERKIQSRHNTFIIETVNNNWEIFVKYII